MLAIVPARGGSKGLPGKNIRRLNGKPMIAYTIEAALQSEHISNVYISTDDQEIYDIALEYGAQSSFLRPANLAEDKSLAIDNYIYTIDRLHSEFGEGNAGFIVLQPTSPLRSVKDIDDAIKLFYEKGADSVISYTEETHPIAWHKYLNENNSFENIFEDKIKNRQGYRPSYYPNGAVYVFSYDLIKKRKYYSEKSFAYVMPHSRSVDVDTLDDFEYAEFLLGKNK